ncbi:MAG: guanylate kinase [Pseudomonadales bacterium]
MSASAAEGLLVIVSAPSGAGKTSLVRALVARDPNVRISISHTTRSRRPREQDGVDYHFTSREAFVDMVGQGDFLEHAEVFGNLYGTAASSITEQRGRGVDVILEIDYQGARQVRARYPDAISIFILPPSRATLAERLERRAEDSAAVIEARLAEAQTEMASHGDYDFLIVNDDFGMALDDLTAIVRAARLRTPTQTRRLGILLDDLLSGA